MGSREKMFFIIVYKVRERMAYLYADGNEPGEGGELLEGCP